jgi:hypothetical protein
VCVGDGWADKRDHTPGPSVPGCGAGRRRLRALAPRPPPTTIASHERANDA